MYLVGEKVRKLKINKNCKMFLNIDKTQNNKVV